MRGKGQNKFLFWIVAIGLVAMALILIFTNPWSTLVQETREINLSPRDQVTKITLASQSDSTTLMLSDSEWTIAGNEAANQVAVENLLFAAGRLSIISLLSFDERDELWTRTTVSYFHGNKEILTYDFYFDGKNYMIHQSGSKSLYVIRLSGFEAIRLSGVFSPVQNHYYKLNLIALLPGEIAELHINIPGKSAYTINQDAAGNYVCFNDLLQAEVPPSSIDDPKVRHLLSYFSDIRYEEIYDKLNASSLRTEMRDKMLAQIEVRSRAGDSHTMAVYPFPDAGGGDPDLFRALVIYNEQSTVLVINYIYLDVLMRDLKSYLL